MPRAARVAHSLSLVHSWFVGGLRPRGPPDRSLAGAPDAPRRSRGSLAAARSLIILSGDFVPADPLARSLAGAPDAPRRSRGSLARSLMVCRARERILADSLTHSLAFWRSVSTAPPR